MSNDAYVVVNPIARIEESKLLSKEQINTMLEGTWEDCISVLKASEYSKCVQQEDFEINFAKYILDYQLSMIEKMYELAPDKKVIELYMLRFTYHNTKMIMKALLSQTEYEPYIVKDQLYQPKEIEDAILRQESEVIHPNLMNAIKEADVQLQQQYKTLGVDIILDRYYIKDLYEVATEIDDKDIMHYICSFIDCNNLSTSLRALKQGKELNYISSILHEHGYLEIEDIVSACESLEKLIAFIGDSAYSDLIHQEDIENISLFDVHGDAYLFKLLEKSQFVAFGPLPLMALLEMHEKQRKNLQLILSAKQSGIDNEIVKERLR